MRRLVSATATAVALILAAVACAGQPDSIASAPTATTGTSRPAPRIPTPVGEDPLPPPVQDRLQKTLDEALPKLTDTPGVLAAVWVPGTGNWASAVGVSDPATREPLATNDHVRIGTTTMSFTTMLVLRLVDQGAIGLDDRVSTWFPDAAERDDTVRGLMGSTEASREALLARIAERASETDYPTLLKRQFLVPLGLEQTSAPVAGDRSLPKPFARGVTRRSPGAAPVDATVGDPAGPAPEGVISTLQDLEVWAYQLGAGRLLAPPTAAAQREFRVLPDGDVRTNLGYGLGLLRLPVDPARPDVWVGYEGSVPGYSTLLAYDTASGAVIVVVALSDIAVALGGGPPGDAGPSVLPARALFAALRDVLRADPPPNSPAVPPSGTGVPGTLAR